uniref:Uncharacterized protein n=1 Tax=Triticum urartu TaxID=4572 RepID=A0A8R7PJ77_TRIUA
MARQQICTQQNEYARQAVILAEICNNFCESLHVHRRHLSQQGSHHFIHRSKA